MHLSPPRRWRGWQRRRRRSGWWLPRSSLATPAIAGAPLVSCRRQGRTEVAPEHVHVLLNQRGARWLRCPCFPQESRRGRSGDHFMLSTPAGQPPASGAGRQSPQCPGTRAGPDDGAAAAELLYPASQGNKRDTAAEDGAPPHQFEAHLCSTFMARPMPWWPASASFLDDAATPNPWQVHSGDPIFRAMYLWKSLPVAVHHEGQLRRWASPHPRCICSLETWWLFT